MSAIKISFVMASQDPGELAAFYEKINGDKFSQGFNTSHYLISLSNGSQIHFFKPSKSGRNFTDGNSASLCFQKGPFKSPKTALLKWSKELIEIGASTKDKPRLEFFGAELWMKDPEGHDFLLLVTCDESIKTRSKLE